MYAGEKQIVNDVIGLLGVLYLYIA